MRRQVRSRKWMSIGSHLRSYAIVLESTWNQVSLLRLQSDVIYKRGTTNYLRRRRHLLGSDS